MNRTALSSTAVLALALTLGPAASFGPASGASTAAAPITLGETSGSPVTCVGGGTVIQGSSAPGGASYTVPGPGVITSFSSSSSNVADQQIRLALFGPPSGSSFPVLAKSATFPMRSATLNTYAVRIPVQAGWVLGAELTTASSNTCGFLTNIAADQLYYSEHGVDGPTVGVTITTHAHLDLSATYEPDADGDGYGDVSQDACPDSALAVVACPAPETAIGKAKVRKRLVTIKLSATVAHSTYLVSVDGKPGKEFLNPYRAMLKPGKHKISVQAVSPLGIADPTAATQTVKVKKPKRH